MAPGALKQKLLRNYLRTTYRVELPAGPLDLSIGEPQAALDRLLKRKGHTAWAFLTAFNPGSERLHPLVNHILQQRLKGAVRRMRHAFIPGSGIPRDAGWEPESSLLVLGISKAKAIKLARLFGQHAIVVGRRGGCPVLLWCY